jgi:hypothetical protein
VELRDNCPLCDDQDPTCAGPDHDWELDSSAYGSYLAEAPIGPWPKGVDLS